MSKELFAAEVKLTARMIEVSVSNARRCIPAGAKQAYEIHAMVMLATENENLRNRGGK